MDLLEGFDSPESGIKRVYFVRLDQKRSISVGHDLPLEIGCVQGEIMGLRPGQCRPVQPGEIISTSLPPGVLVHFWLVEFML